MRIPTPSLLVVLALGALAFAPWSAPVSHAETQFVTGLAASVNQKPITWGEVRAAVRAQIQVIAMTERDPEKRQLAIAEAEGNALNDLIDRELILAAFEEKGGVIKKQYVDQDIARIIRENFDGSQPKFEEELKRTGMTYRQFRELREKMLIVQYMRGSQIEDPSPPTPDQLQSFVRDNRELFKEPDFAKVRTITVPKFTAELGSTKETQLALIKEIRGKITKEGADFAQMAKSYSQDSKSTDGGDWGWIDKRQLNKQLSEVAFSLSANQVSDIIEDATNYYLITLDAKKEGEVKTLDDPEVREQAEKRVMQEERKKRHDKWLERLRSKAIIKIYDK